MALYVAYSVAVLVLLAWNLFQVREYVRDQAHREIQATLAKGETLRHWAVEHGGIYVPADDDTRPDPLLSFLPERDVRTTDGRLLTLVNPATLLTQYYGTVASSNEVWGRLISSRPINPKNSPDAWEQRALERVAQTRDSLVETVATNDGGSALRVLKPRFIAEPCLKCHQAYGRETGDLAGAVSLSVPLDTEYAHREYGALALGYGTLWLLGMLGINRGGRMLAGQVARRDAAFRALADQEHRTSTIVEGSLDAIVTVDNDDFIAEWNVQAVHMFGWTRAEAVGRTFADTLLAEADVRYWREAGHGPDAADGRRFETTAIHRSGRRFPVELSISPLHGHDRASCAVFIRNLTAQKRAREKIERDYVSQQVIANLLKLSIEPISFQKRLERGLALILSTPWLSIQAKGAIFLTGKDGRSLVLVAEQGLSESVREGCATVAFGQCLCGRAAERQETVFADCIDHRHDQIFPDMHPHGHYCLPILSGDALLGVLTLYVDEGHRRKEDEHRFLVAISHTLGGMIQRYRAEEQLHYAAFYDELTRLPNRALFTDRLDHALRRFSRDPSRRSALLYLDLDRFKNINDSLGHAAGDEVLLTVANRLLECVRPGDTVSRLGGDEYTLLLDEIGEPEEALTVARRIHRSLQHPFTVAGGHEVFTTASVGVAMVRKHHRRGDDLLREADTAMYQAKRQGTARTAVFDEDMHHRAVALLTLETEIRRAVDRGEFRVHYQPIVGTRDGAVQGFEALARWQHPERGIVSPAEFIPIAEETGLINDIGRSVLVQACTQLRHWHRDCGSPTLPYVSVNLSAAQFLQHGLVAQVDEALAESGLPAEHLALEVTESTLITDPQSVGRTLATLKGRGIGLYIDDFGTGYSSLSYLHKFPFDSLKIDRSFTARLGDGEEHLGVVQAVIAIARHLGMAVIAEGVETREQLIQLQRLGCERVQGFYYSAPLPPPEVERWIADASHRQSRA